jgi:hypothetical protein
MIQSTLKAAAATASLGAALCLLGCPPCQRLCEAEAEVYSMCLGEWDMTWTHVGYAGVEEYENTCKDEVQLEQDRRTDAEKREVSSVCADRNTDLRSSDDCEELYGILESFGSE